MDGVLVATGGGAVLDPANRDLMRHTGLVVYLRTSVGRQLERLDRDRSRPLLQTGNKVNKLIQLANDRNPLYKATADLTFAVKNRNIDNTVDKIRQAICRYRDDPATARRDARNVSSET
jgi:shikimate kinase